MPEDIRIRVMVVEEDPAVSRKLRTWLEQAGYTVQVCRSAAEAQQFAERVSVNLALVALRVGGGAGPDLIRRLRARGLGVPAIAMAAFPDVPQVVEALRAGACDLLEKPIQGPTLLGRIEEHLAASGVLARDEDQFNRRLGRRLRGLRQAVDLTLEQVAQGADITSAQLSQIELGKTATTTWTLARICAALRIPMRRVFEDA